MIEQTVATLSPDTRRQQIIELLERDGEQAVDALATRFGVSGMTIRRDLQALAERGTVMRTRGGAAPSARVAFEFRFLDRMREHAEHKDAIARIAVEQVEPGQHVFLDSSTTTLAIARRLRGRGPLTVITTSLPIASELFGLDDIEVILLGGVLRKDTPDLAGALTEQTLELLRAEVAFLGADAVDSQGWAYTGSPEVARLLQAMARSADRAYIVADHTKLGRQALLRFAELYEWTGLITDSAADASVRAALSDAGVNVLVPEGRGGP